MREWDTGTGYMMVTLGSYSWATKGFAMLSMPSMGQMRVTAVPRHTTRPRVRVS